MDGHSLNDDPAPGWYRELVARRSGDKVDAYYYPPDGTQLRSRPDVRRYFEAHPDEAKVGDRRSRRPAVPSRHRNASWVVSGPNLGRFGPDGVFETAMPRAGTLDPQSDFQFAYSKVPSSEIARCKPLDRTAISEELRRLWDALSDDQRKVYDQKADQLKGEMARERLIAARTARDRAVEAALELGAKDRDARLIAARQTKQLFPDVDWEQLVKPSSPRSSELPPTPSSKVSDSAQKMNLN